MTQLRGITEEASFASILRLALLPSRIKKRSFIFLSQDIASARSEHDREARMARVAILEQCSDVLDVRRHVANNCQHLENPGAVCGHSAGER